jgi:DNA-binding NarL/FixJ family response regulator
MKHILFLEDEPSTQNWFSEILKEAFGAVRIIIAESISEAQSLVTEHPFNLAIVDIYLPDGQGIDFINKIKQIKPGLFCVVLTAFDDSKSIFSSLRAGADGYLLKSQDKDKLLTLLKDIMHGAPPLSPSIARRIIKHFSNDRLSCKNDILTKREEEVLIFIAKGMTRNETADLLEIQPGTVAGYIKHIYEKLNVSSRAEAAIEAQRMGLI